MNLLALLLLGAASVTEAATCVGIDACLAAPGLSVTGDNSCNGDSACKYAVSATVGGDSCNDVDACYGAEGTTMGDNSCNGGSTCKNAEGATVGGGSCNATEACNSAAGATVGDNSCNAQFACFEADNAYGTTVGDNSCNAWSACIRTEGDEIATVGDNSCNARSACLGADLRGGATVGGGSCNAPSACTYAYSVGVGSCNGDAACELTVATGDNSCNGLSACRCINIGGGACKTNSGNVGDNSCNGDSACSRFIDYAVLNIGSNSCNGIDACKCDDPKGDGGNIGDGECNLDELTQQRTCCLSTTAAPTVAPSTPTVAPSPNNNDGATAAPTVAPTSSSCFSASDEVFVEGKGTLFMKELQTRDKVFVGIDNTTGGAKFEAVYSFGHHDASTPTEFLRIYTSMTTTPLEITPSHLIHVVGGSEDPVRADSVQVGDVLTQMVMGNVGRSNGSMYINKEQVTVTKIAKVIRGGAFQPLTPCGSIVVNGIHASTYVSLSEMAPDVAGQLQSITGMSDQRLFHWWLAPYRMLCLSTSTSSTTNCICDYSNVPDSRFYNNDGISYWLVFGKELVQLGNRLGLWAGGVLLLVVCVGLAPFVAGEMAIVTITSANSSLLLMASMTAIAMIVVVSVLPLISWSSNNTHKTGRGRFIVLSLFSLRCGSE